MRSQSVRIAKGTLAIAATAAAGVISAAAGVAAESTGLGDVPHTATLEVTGPTGQRRVDTDTWFPGSGFWELEVIEAEASWGNAGEPREVGRLRDGLAL